MLRRILLFLRQGNGIEELTFSAQFTIPILLLRIRLHSNFHMPYFILFLIPFVFLKYKFINNDALHVLLCVFHLQLLGCRILEELCTSDTEGCRQFLDKSLPEIRDLLLESLSTSAVSSKGVSVTYFSLNLKMLKHI